MHANAPVVKESRVDRCKRRRDTSLPLTTNVSAIQCESTALHANELSHALWKRRRGIDLPVDSETPLDDVVVNCPRCGRRTLPRPSVLPELRRYRMECGDWHIDGITGRLHLEQPRGLNAGNGCQ